MIAKETLLDSIANLEWVDGIICAYRSVDGSKQFKELMDECDGKLKLVSFVLHEELMHKEDAVVD